ncbi:MAG: hypothetical protein FD157_1866 [Rhodocyclaceae bacterium]|nr:MAG: hypothetical protein FD157_1866 [Rhodocyclaceae bacterium]TNC99246.1 MAG: hypothetical protein FD118_3817 [Rhodocyclaceae bacterium]
MMTAEQNYRLLQEIDANRRFLLLVYRSNPTLQALAEESAGLKWDDWRESSALPCAEKGERIGRLGRRPAGTDF